MNTREAAKVLHCTPGHVRFLLRKKVLPGIKTRERCWLVDLSGLEEYQRKYGIGVNTKTETDKQPSTMTQPVKQEPHGILNTNKTAVTNPETAEIIQELESKSYFTGGTNFNMAQLFWLLSQFFLDGIESEAIFPTLLQALPGSDQDKKAVAANEILRMLMFELRTLGLVHDEQRGTRTKAYVVVVVTGMGLKVIRVLESRHWPRL